MAAKCTSGIHLVRGSGGLIERKDNGDGSEGSVEGPHEEAILGEHAVKCLDARHTRLLPRVRMPRIGISYRALDTLDDAFVCLRRCVIAAGALVVAIVFLALQGGKIIPTGKVGRRHVGLVGGFWPLDGEKKGKNMPPFHEEPIKALDAHVPLFLASDQIRCGFARELGLWRPKPRYRMGMQLLAPHSQGVCVFGDYPEEMNVLKAVYMRTRHQSGRV